MCPKLKVLLIEDNPGDAGLIREMLSEAGLRRFAGMTPDRESSDDALILAAEQALYQAKQEGRNRVKICDLTHDNENEKIGAHL